MEEERRVTFANDTENVDSLMRNRLTAHAHLGQPWFLALLLLGFDGLLVLFQIVADLCCAQQLGSLAIPYIRTGVHGNVYLEPASAWLVTCSNAFTTGQGGRRNL
jgi:hypothetical protein